MEADVAPAWEHRLGRGVSARPGNYNLTITCARFLGRKGGALRSVEGWGSILVGAVADLTTSCLSPPLNLRY